MGFPGEVSVTLVNYHAQNVNKSLPISQLRSATAALFFVTFVLFDYSTAFGEAIISKLYLLLLSINIFHCVFCFAVISGQAADFSTLRVVSFVQFLNASQNTAPFVIVLINPSRLPDQSTIFLLSFGLQNTVSFLSDVHK